MEFPKPPVILIKSAAPIVGGIMGFAYYKFVGCTTGACPITGNPFISTLYGALLGYLIGSQFTRTSPPDSKQTDTL